MPIFYYTHKENGVYYPRYRLIIAHDNIASDFPIVAKSVARSELSMRPYSRGLIRVGDPKWEYVMPSQVICQNESSALVLRGETLELQFRFRRPVI